MALYHVHFVDHGDNIYRTHHFESDHDEAAVDAARRLHSPTIGAGFEVWHEERLVHRERNFPHS